MIPVIDFHTKKEISWEDFVREFGEPKIKALPADVACWRIVRLEVDRAGPHSIQAILLDPQGNPVVNKAVAFYWSDAPAPPDAPGPPDGLLEGMNPLGAEKVMTKEDGSAHYSVGKGSYYFAPRIGPHGAWHYGNDEPSEVILGLGMLGETEHHHYNVVFQWTGEREENGGGDGNGKDDNGEGNGKDNDGNDGGNGSVDPIAPGEPGQLCQGEGQVKISTALYDVPFPVPIEFRGCPVTGRGVHWGSDWYHKTWLEKNAENDFWTRWARSMHLSWAVVLSTSDSALLPHDVAGGRSAVQVLLDAGIIPMLRIGSKLPRGYTHAAHVETFVKQAEPYGVPAYLLVGNEFGDPREWSGQGIRGKKKKKKKKKGDVPKDWMAQAFAWWIGTARTCLQYGVIAGFPDGPDYDLDAFEFMRTLPGRGYCSTSDVDEFFRWWEDGKVFYAGHHYGLNRPPEFPDDPASRDGEPLTVEQHKASLKGRYDWYKDREQDPPLSIINEQRAAKAWNKLGRSRSSRTASWRSWERVVEWMKKPGNFGKIMPIALTEGGWTPNAIAGTTPETIDARWPKPIPETVADYTVQVFDHKQHPLFAQCPWTAADMAMEGPGTWETDAWYTGHYTALGYDMDLEVVHALRKTTPRLLTEQFHLSEE